MNELCETGYVPEEQYSQKQSTEEASKIDYRLTNDLSSKLRQPLQVVSTDTSDCYNGICHIIMLLLLVSITRWEEAIAALLLPIQTMKFYQQTGLGNSSTYMGGPGLWLPLQELC